MIIGCTGNYRKHEYIKIINEIINYIDKSNANIDLIVSSDIQAIYPKKIIKCTIDSFDVLLKKSDYLIAIGGDGTILSTCRRMGNAIKPMIGIHLGGLGFLAQVKKGDIENTIESLIKEKFYIEKRYLIEVSIKDGNKIQKYNCLNDIVIDHGASGRVLKTKVSIGDSLINIFESDGVIFSTATGSTAYSLSAGGPIIYPSVDTITVTPICPHSLSARPIVLQPEEVITMRFPDPYEGIALAVDGQIRISVDNNSRIKISRARHSAQLVSLPSNGYFKTLRTKMGWSGNVR